MVYPTTLIASEWVDLIQGLRRDEAVAALATFHRRVEDETRIAATRDPVPLSAITAPRDYPIADAVSEPPQPTPCSTIGSMQLGTMRLGPG